MTIGHRLKLVREKFNLSLGKAAAFFDITGQTLSRYENGRRTPDNDFLEAFGKHFNLSGNWLLYGEAPIFKATEEMKDSQEVFLELASSIQAAGVDSAARSELLRLSMEELTEDTPANFIIMLEYMLKNPEIRKNMFQFFHLFQKPLAEKGEDR